MFSACKEDLAYIFSVEPLSVPYCDLCEPKLLDCTRPGSRPSNLKSKAVMKGLPGRVAQLKLDNWHETVFE